MIEINDLNFTENEIKNMNLLSMAFIGDSVFDLFIRMKLFRENPRYNAHTLTKNKFLFVNAKTQHEIMKTLFYKLNEEEINIFKRGRNTKVNTKAKSATIGEYHDATGFEALIGFLYLSGKKNRLNEIMEFSYNLIRRK